MSRHAKVALVLASMVAASTQAATAEPLKMAHSGYLLDGGDQPLSGTHNMTFRIHDASTLKWEASCPVNVTNGYYSVVLGQAPCDGATSLNSDHLAATGAWLELVLGTVTLSPRIAITLAPQATIATRALTAETLGTHGPEAFALAGHTHAASGISDFSTAVTGALEGATLAGGLTANGGFTGSLAGVIKSDATTTCNGATSGAVRWTGSAFESCNGTAWALVTTGSGGSGSTTGDPYWANVVLALHMDGTNGGTSFVDERAHAIIAVNATLSTAQAKFGTASGSFNGSSAELTSPDSADWDFGSGDFTIEAWVYPNSLAGVQRIVAAGNSGAGAWNLWALGFGEGWGGGNKVNLAVYGGSGYIDFYSTANLLTVSAWNHVVAMRSGNIITFFINGVFAGASAYALTTNGGTAGLVVGCREAGGGHIEFANAYIDDLRITKGVARYSHKPVAAFSTSSTTIEIVESGGTRHWSDGTYAATCDQYLHPASGYAYAAATGDGIYTVSLSGTPTPVYCDMTTDGGGWMLVLHAGSASLPSSAYDMAIQQIMIRNEALKTATDDSTNYPVLPNGRANSYDRVLFKGGNSTWQGLMGAWVSFATVSGATGSISPTLSSVLTASGRTAAYLAYIGWSGSSVPLTGVFSLWDANGISPICGGAEVAKGKNCPLFNQSSAAPYHHDITSARDLLVK